jgi:hypothetical protein
MPATHQAYASQARVARIVGLSLAGLWLAVSVLAAVASSLDATESTTIAAAEVTADVVAVSN